MSKKGDLDYTDVRQLTRMVEEAYRERGKAVSRVSQKRNWTDDQIDYDAPRVKRRVSATVKTTPSLVARVKGFCPNIPDVFSCEEEWAAINASAFSAYDIMEEEDTLTLAAAIWMLDHIREERRLHEAIQCFTEDDGALYDVYLPDVWDACHSDEVLRGMMDAIQQRNADCSATREQSRTQRENERRQDRFFMDDYTTAGIHRQQVPSRQRFEALIELIPRSAIDRAVKRCEDKMWEWAERYFRCRGMLAEEENKLAAKSKRFYRQTETRAKELKERRDALGAAVKHKGPMMPPLPMPPEPDVLRPVRERLPSDMIDALSFMENIRAEEERLDNAREALSDQIVDFQLAAQIVNASGSKSALADFGKEIEAIMKGFSIDDPYEICFGMLYLIDSGSDLPWMYFVGLNVLHQARIRLPWHCDEYDEADDPIWSDTDSFTGEKRPEFSEDDLPPDVVAPKLPDWYGLYYVDRNQDPMFQFDVNLAQIFYELTGTIMPRNLKRYFPSLLVLSDYGIKGKKATLLLLFCMALAGEVRRRSRDTRRLFDDADDYRETMDQEPDGEEGEPASASAPQLMEEIEALKKENKRLNQALHNADREARDIRERTDAQARAAENQRQELADLRTLVFHREEGIVEDDIPSDPGITFPYETRRRVLVFGGHDSWSKEIKPRLPDVRFIGKDVVPDMNLLRNADIIWIQTNCISHKQYDKIMGVARRRDVPVRYFSYASAEKCAEQVVQEDRK